jgi:hypothetical protein
VLLLLVVPAACLCLVLVACSEAHSQANPVALAAQKTLGKGSEHITMHGTVSVGPTSIPLVGSGDFQVQPRLGRATFKLRGVLSATIREVLDGQVIYMDSPLFQQAIPAGKDWVSLDLGTASTRAGIDFTQFRQTTPTDTLLGLQHATRVAKVGTATIAGEPTVRYRAVVDFRRVPNGARIEKLAHVTTLPVQVWIGKDGLVRRLEMTYSAAVSKQRATTSLTMNLSKFGEPVHVQVPSPEKTIDMSKLGG